MNNVIFWHTYLVGDFKIIIQDQITKLFTSGLYDGVTSINVGISSPNQLNIEWIISLLKSYDKFKYTIHTENDGEKPTMRLLMNYAKAHNCNIMYFHTKSVSNTGYNNILWRMSMDYNIIYKWKECIKILNDGADAVGCNLRYNTHVGYYPHFSGTYWWSNSNYIKTLNEDYLYNKDMLGPQNPLSVEFFIGSNNTGNLQSIFECKNEAPYRVECLINEYIK